MEEILAALRALSARYRDSDSDEARELSWELDVLLQATPAPAYQHRHHMAWDNTWLDLDETQLEHVLNLGHTVERRALAGGWEPVITANPETTP
jgi:hypothetical protein